MRRAMTKIAASEAKVYLQFTCLSNNPFHLSYSKPNVTCILIYTIRIY